MCRWPAAGGSRVSSPFLGPARGLLTAVDKSGWRRASYGRDARRAVTAFPRTLELVSLAGPLTLSSPHKLNADLEGNRLRDLSTSSVIVE